MWKSVWKDPVWAGVISGTLLLVLPAILATGKGWWPAIWAGVAGFFALETTIYVWLLLVLALGASLLVLLVAWALFSQWFMRSEEAPDFKAYKQDEFHDLIWRWDYSDTGKINRLAAFCSACDYELQAKDRWGHFHSGRSVFFSCECCGRMVENDSPSAIELELSVVKKIQQKLRIGTWRPAVERMRERNQALRDRAL